LRQLLTGGAFVRLHLTKGYLHLLAFLKVVHVNNVFDALIVIETTHVVQDYLPNSLFVFIPSKVEVVFKAKVRIPVVVLLPLSALLISLLGADTDLQVHSTAGHHRLFNLLRK
jgi:uncharacterized membrane protein